jgi:hypothetical protein
VKPSPIPRSKHHWWDDHFVGARPAHFPLHIGAVDRELLDHVETCSRCSTKTSIRFGGKALCLAHAVTAESLAAGRTEQRLLSTPEI